jgi:hypothetical protein
MRGSRRGSGSGIELARLQVAVWCDCGQAREVLARIRQRAGGQAGVANGKGGFQNFQRALKVEDEFWRGACEAQAAEPAGMRGFEEVEPSIEIRQKPGGGQPERSLAGEGDDALEPARAT